jgi:hypothetical protein
VRRRRGFPCVLRAFCEGFWSFTTSPIGPEYAHAGLEPLR